jgi:hypothetical protein
MSPEEIRGWEQNPVSELFLGRIREIIHSAYADVVKDVLSNEFHKASRSAGVLSALEEVLVLPDVLIEEMKNK